MPPRPSGSPEAGTRVGTYLGTSSPLRQSVFSLCAPALAIDSSPSSLSSHFTLTLLSLVFWPVYIFATLTAHCKFPPNRKKLELPPTPPAEPARAPLTCSFILCAYFHFPFLSHYRVSQTPFLPTTVVWAALGTQHIPLPSRITRLVHITSHVFVRRLRR